MSEPQVYGAGGASSQRLLQTTPPAGPQGPGEALARAGGVRASVSPSAQGKAGGSTERNPSAQRGPTPPPGGRGRHCDPPPLPEPSEGPPTRAPQAAGAGTSERPVPGGGVRGLNAHPAFPSPRGLGGPLPTRVSTFPSVKWPQSLHPRCGHGACPWLDRSEVPAGRAGQVVRRAPSGLPSPSRSPRTALGAGRGLCAPPLPGAASGDERRPPPSRETPSRSQALPLPARGPRPAGDSVPRSEPHLPRRADPRAPVPSTWWPSTQPGLLARPDCHFPCLPQPHVYQAPVCLPGWDFRILQAHFTGS
nr:SH3 domain-containing protein C23A1.17-like [Macaca nemestrina]